MPLFWLKQYKTSSGQSSKIICTTMGAATDFRSEDLRRLVVNASFWSVGLESKIKPDLDVTFVDKFQPTDFGFGEFQKGRRPEFYDLINK